MENRATVIGIRSPSEVQGKACNLCGGWVGVLIPGVPAIVRCSSCGLDSLEVFPSSGEREDLYQHTYYREGTGDRFLGPLELAVRFLKKLRRRAILMRLTGLAGLARGRRLARAGKLASGAKGPGAILDVGCGRGDLLQLFEEKGWRAVGTQVSRTAAEAARKRRGVEVLLGELPELGLPRGHFDVVTFLHVLEHLERPSDYLLAARDLLKPEGLLVVEVPDCASPGFRLLGRRNLCFDYPHHLIFFTPRSLRRLLERTGFEVGEVSRFRLEYSPFTTLQNLLNILPGKPNRLYRSFMRNEEGARLRRNPWTWVHAVLGSALALPALVISLAGLVLPVGNTMTFYCRKAGEKCGGEGGRSTCDIGPVHDSRPIDL